MNSRSVPFADWEHTGGRDERHNPGNFAPPRLYQQIRTLVTEGWFRDEDDLFIEALRRFLDVRRPDLLEQFIREDVEWGLHGEE